MIYGGIFFPLFGNNLSELICHIKLKFITFAVFLCVEKRRVRVRVGSRECHWHKEKMWNRGQRDLRRCNWYGFELIKWKVFPISDNFYFRNMREFLPFNCQMFAFFSISVFSSLLYYTKSVFSNRFEYFFTLSSRSYSWPCEIKTKIYAQMAHTHT